MDPQTIFGLGALGAVPVTALLCRRRVARRQRIGFGTMTLGALIPAVLAFAFAFMAEAGTDIFTRSFWAQCLNANHKEPPSMLLFVFAFVVAVCALPAMVVVIYYQARNKHEKPEV